ncbi:hypothetical protein [Streptomyces sp. NPDC003036]|uniref:effector-associated constant component EACC1 n=1 Tax=Streptomyces sp. NPDC003036 TaxID=3154442 RepID=UPI0033A7676A
MIFETLAISLSGVTAAAAFASVIVALRKIRENRNRTVSISIKGKDRNIHIDATGMSEREILRLINSLESDDERSGDTDSAAT